MTMTSELKIGNVTIARTGALAPMAGVADTAFRRLCRRFGAAYVVTEMVSAKGITYGDRKSAQLMQLTKEERPGAIQLFGDEPLTLAKAALAAMEHQPDMIDINMGCPAPKIAGNGGGSALMKNPALAGEIVKAVVGAVPVPVTVKIRKGWDDTSVNAVEIAKICEQNGAAAIAVHGRTRAQMYAPPVDPGIIGAVKGAVKVPVIANGDVDSAQAAKAMYEATGCDLVMIGRGALGAPWLFEQIAHYLATAELLPDPPLPKRMEIMLAQVAQMIEYKGECIALNEARKHCGWYMKGLNGAATLRRQAGSIASLQEVQALVQMALALNPQE